MEYLDDQTIEWLLITVPILILGFYGAAAWLWTLVLAPITYFYAPIWLQGIFIVWAVLFNLPIIRQLMISKFIMWLFKKLDFIPAISETERTALEAGVVWVEGELFSGKPNFKKLMKEPYPQLTKEEQDFIRGPVEKLCAMLDDWDIWERRRLPDDVWSYIRKERFLGMIIPKEYGGLGFTAMAHSEVLMKIASRSMPAVISVMVPNSLGPAELLIHYGTDAQRKKYLPRLAVGDEIPCFALTEPVAGSDAGAITADGVLFKGSDGKIYVKLNWNKRYITLAAISTILGLAFKLRDPDNILGKGPDLGITCALIPSNTQGVVLGRRHDPLGVPFYNCPTQGKDVVVVAEDAIIGGLNGAGHGWKMLMECLAAGRGISLPAQAIGATKLMTKAVSAHATVRKQFGVSLGKFEGIEEPLARIGGYNYLLEAMRRYTLGGLDQGIKPPVITAIVKYQATELSRKLLNDAMDVMAGNAISRGPRNLMANLYIGSPISITVEGANILTRTLIIFGQGAMRAHPYAFKEVNAVEKGDLKSFDRAFWGHIGHVVRNLFRAVLLSLTRGWLAPGLSHPRVSKYFRRFTWCSASFAIMADIAMGSMGGSLKLREKITGRFADILSFMYIGTAVLRRFKAEGSRKEDLPFVHFALNHCLYECQRAFDGIFTNIKVPGLTWFFRGVIKPWSNLNSLAGEPYDIHTHKIAKLILADTDQRQRLTEGIFVPNDPNKQLARLERAFHAVKQAEAIEEKIRHAIKAKKIPRIKGPKVIAAALEAGVITKAESEALVQAEILRLDAIQVDDFTQEEYLTHSSHQNSSRVSPLQSTGTNGKTTHN